MRVIIVLEDGVREGVTIYIDKRVLNIAENNISDSDLGIDADNLKLYLDSEVLYVALKKKRIQSTAGVTLLKETLLLSYH